MADKIAFSPKYHDSFFDSCQDKLDAACARGMSEKRLEQFFVGLYTDKSRAINTDDVQDVTMGTLEKNILRPRQDLYVFILYNWITLIFIPRSSLPSRGRFSFSESGESSRRTATSASSIAPTRTLISSPTTPSRNRNSPHSQRQSRN